MTTYKWIISSMQTKPKDGSLTDVVIVVDWRRGATKDDVYTDVYGTMSCPQPSDSDFTPYDQLTYDQVCSWLDAGLPVEELDANLDIALENIINPKVVTLPLPFVNPQ